MSAYPVPPPSYTRPSDEETPLVDVDAPRSAESEPLLAGNAHVDVDDSDVPDDFKYGTTVSDSAPQIRKAFIRKVYSILLLQILTTTIIAGVLSQTAPAVEWVLNQCVSIRPSLDAYVLLTRDLDSLWAFFVPLIGTLVNLILLQWKRHSHPLNLVLLSSFTILEGAS
ncbi:hypothetical protein MKEN_00407500 [Mycena kentingensis (nom. inval.)]|nr:hypothetical protein MKEN_00407500 [Mycena kentingensis (nom. inval.)]